jgi:hypothetical protein
VENQCNQEGKNMMGYLLTLGIQHSVHMVMADMDFLVLLVEVVQL